MSDSSVGVLSKLGYINMWCKPKDYSASKTALPTKVLGFASEKRVPFGKIWIGCYGSMAKAAHAYDLVAEAFQWPERHYGRSELLSAKGAELRKDLGANFDINKHEDRRKIAEHASNYASLFPCSDSKQILLKYFHMWAASKGPGQRCHILLEKPKIEEDPSDDHFYPLDLLPPLVVPDTQKTKGQAPKAAIDKNWPKCVLGTRDIHDEMGVEPDLVSCIMVDDPGAKKNERGAPCFYQQWTWCTRRSKSEMNKRGFRPPTYPFPNFSETTFHQTPSFVTGPRDCRPFSFLNFQIYRNINNLSSRPKTRYAACEWKGTSMDKFEPEPSEVSISHYFDEVDKALDSSAMEHDQLLEQGGK